MIPIVKSIKSSRILGLLLVVCFCQQGFVVGACAEEQARLITLSDGIARVLEDSRLVKIAMLDEEMAFQDSLIARSALLPQLNISASQTFFKFQPAARLGATVAPTSQRQFASYGFDVYQTIFDFGRSLSFYRASHELVSARATQVESVKRVAVLEFIVGYFDLLESEKLIEVATKEVESLGLYLHDIEQLFAQGAATKNDLLPAKVRLADAKQKLIVSRNTRAVAAARLNNMLALSLSEEIRCQDVYMPPPKTISLEDAWSQAQFQRPEILFFTQQIKASTLAEKGKAVANYLTFFADSGYSFTENKYQAHEGNYFAELGAKANLFDGGAAKADVRKEHQRQLQLGEQKDKLIEDIKLEVKGSYLGLRDARERVNVAKDARAEAEENVRVNRVKYAEGSATVTDVLEAITLQTTAQTNYANADYELKRNIVKFLYSTGNDLASLYGSPSKDSHGTQKR